MNAEQCGFVPVKENLRCLIVEDEFSARKLTQDYLSDVADCAVAVNGLEAVRAVKAALEENKPYHFILLDISMPEMDGQQALQQIRDLEARHGIYGLDGVRVIMTTAFGDKNNILQAFNTGCEAYLIKPIKYEALFHELMQLGFVKQKTCESV